ncbi:MAG: LamG domain-containing protein, partial [Planctomycetes bacterium]|nr:LamG domain-containing protein [Planctomycetota bacterium]
IKIIQDNADKLHLEVDNSSAGGSCKTATSGEFLDNTWHHVYALFDAGTIKCYRDGVQDLLSTGTGVFNYTHDDEFASTQQISMKSGGYEGLVDDFRFFDRALTDLEIQQLYELGN